MQKCRKFLMALLCLCLFLSISVIPASAATTAILDWYLVDSGKHLDWKGSTSYQTQFNSAVSTWNNYKSGVIRKDAWNTINDVTISDYYEVSSTAGVTSSAGTIKFNTYQMDNFTSAQKQNVCTHELGHALGLAHNAKGDVMYAYVSSLKSLSANDKASYDASYKRY